MSRKPAHLEMVGGKSARQRIWEAVRTHLTDGTAFTTTDLYLSTRVDPGIISDYVKCLRAGLFIEPVDSKAKAGVTTRYIAILDNGVEAPRLRKDGSAVTSGRGNEAMWQAMRNFLPTFDYREVSAYASTAEHPVLPETAKAYVLTLAAAGYLDEVQPAKRGCHARPARYKLRRDHDNGPRPPMIQRTRSVYDPNLGRVVWNEEPSWEGEHV